MGNIQYVTSTHIFPHFKINFWIHIWPHNLYLTRDFWFLLTSVVIGGAFVTTLLIGWNWRGSGNWGMKLIANVSGLLWQAVMDDATLISWDGACTGASVQVARWNVQIHRALRGVHFAALSNIIRILLENSAITLARH